GARLASDQPAIAIMGDGGIQFTLPELMSAVDHNVPAIILIWHNDGYGEIRNFMRERDLPTIGVDIGAPDYRVVADAFGAAYARIQSVDDLRGQLQAAAAAKGPTVLEIHERDAFIQDLGADYAWFS